MSINLLVFDLETSGKLPEFALQSWRAPHDAFITSLVWMHDGIVHGGLNPTKDDLLNMLVYAQENDCTIAGWNTQFDVQWLIAYGLEDEVFKCKYIDGMLLWRHLTIEPEYDATGARKKSYGLKAAVDEFMPAMAGYEENIDFHDPSPEAREKLHYYNICDVRFTASFVKKFLKELSQRQRKCALIEAECIPLIASANYRGMVVDVPAVEALAAKLELTANEKLAELAPHGVTELIIRSPAKLAKLLYDDWGLPPQGLTDSGARSTDKAALYELSLIDPRAKQLREYREALNNKTKFAETILESAAYNGDSTTHPQAIIFGTYSGRLTYASNQGRGKEQRQTGFALHQMKRGAEYRAAIKAPDGYTLLEFDAAGQEFRWMAIASNDKAMLKLCMPGQDAHAFMGNKINPNADDKKAARQLGKIANLSLGYRTSAKKLRTVARVQYNLPMEQPEADTIHAAYQDAYSNVPVFWKQQIDHVKEKGFVETYGHRRVSVYGDWNGDGAWSMGSTAINYRIQGTGADQKYLALAVLKPYLIEIGARFAWDLHDGIYLYVPDDKVHDAAEQIKLTLDNLPYDTAWGFTPPIPLPWDCKVGKSWGDLKEYVFEPVVAADAPDQEGASHLTVPALPEDGAPLDGRHMDSSAKSNKASSNLVQVDFRPPNEHALDVALEFAAAGIKTFPCQSDKKPAPGFMDWENAASSDPDQLRHWFLIDYKDTAAMVGMPCGPNNLVAIDPDRPKPEKGKTADGLVLFKNLVHELSIDLSGVPIIKSPSGGQHYIFAQPNDARFGCATGSLPDNVDVKGDGGYLIASGSRRADGRAYEQMPGTPSLLGSFRANTIPAMPHELRAIIGSKRAKASLDATAERMPKHLLAEALLEHNIPNDREFEDRQKWVDMAHAIYGASGGDDAGRRMWLHWCSSQQQKPGEPEHVWNSIKADTVRAGAGYIKKQLTDRGRNELIDKIKHAEAQGIFTPIEGQGADDPKPDAPPLISLTPYVRKDPKTLPRREWLYGRHYVRKFTSASVAPGGVGKSSVVMVEAVSMAIGRGLLHDEVKQPLKVWLWNGEDPREEIDRRLEAIVQHFQLSADDIAMMEQNLWIDTGREQEIKIIRADKTGTHIATPLITAMINAITKSSVDVVVIDPFISTHAVSENDNNAIDQAAKLWGQIAGKTNTSIELVHHVRKTNGAEVTVADARGASAMVDATRATRAFNKMTDAEAKKARIKEQERWRYFREDDGKVNMAPPSKARWVKMESIQLPNGGFGIEGDNVGVATEWLWTNPASDISDDAKDNIISTISRNPDGYGAHHKATDWAGNIVAEELGIDPEDPDERAHISSILQGWLADGDVRKVKRQKPGKSKSDTRWVFIGPENRL